MMDSKKIDDGGPAFPECKSRDSEPGWLREGMTLRDWFAGQALSQCIQDAPAGSMGGDYPAAHGSPMHKEALQTKRDNAARIAYEYADAMIAARKDDGDE